MRSGKLGGFRPQFRGSQALLVDGVHFLANKEATQEEFLHTYEALHKRGRPVAVTSECHPRLIGGLMPELADRLLGGGVWALEPPDPATRQAILRAKAGRLGCPLPEEAVQFLAGQLRGNVRELEGALHAVHHYSLVHRQPVTPALVRQATGNLIRHAARAVQLRDVERALCVVLGLEVRALHARGKARAVSHPRMLAMYLARKHTAAPYGEIGRYFGGRNHSTVIAAERKVNTWLEDDAPLLLGDRQWSPRDLLEQVERELARS
jgi:chromosomal replication initiator protein